MTAALAAVAAAGVLVAVIVGLVARRATARAGAVERRVEELGAELREAAERLRLSDQDKRAAEVKAAASEARLRVADQRTADAERRAGEAESRVAEAMRRADEAARAVPRPPEAGAVGELERIRIEREWVDVVGPGVPLPVPWDGTIAAVVATELAVIRETIGTPSELAVGTGANAPADAAPLAARACVELLRALARTGEEMAVALDGEALVVTQPVSPGEEPPDLAPLAAVLQDGGLTLSVDRDEGRATARLQLVSPRER